jgi:hypothetical protein
MSANDRAWDDVDAPNITMGMTPVNPRPPMIRTRKLAMAKIYIVSVLYLLEQRRHTPVDCEAKLARSAPYIGQGSCILTGGTSQAKPVFAMMVA